jgi:hypothetical protein
MWEWGAILDDLPADDPEGGGSALWATGADVDADDVLAFIVANDEEGVSKIFGFTFPRK